MFCLHTLDLTFLCIPFTLPLLKCKFAKLSVHNLSEKILLSKMLLNVKLVLIFSKFWLYNFGFHLVALIFFLTFDFLRF